METRSKYIKKPCFPLSLFLNLSKAFLCSRTLRKWVGNAPLLLYNQREICHKKFNNSFQKLLLTDMEKYKSHATVEIYLSRDGVSTNIRHKLAAEFCNFLPITGSFCWCCCCWFQALWIMYLTCPLRPLIFYLSLSSFWGAWRRKKLKSKQARKQMYYSLWETLLEANKEASKFGLRNRKPKKQQFCGKRRLGGEVYQRLNQTQKGKNSSLCNSVSGFGTFFSTWVSKTIINIS